MTAYAQHVEKTRIEDLECKLNTAEATIRTLHEQIAFYDETLDSIRIFVNAYHALKDTGEDGVCPTMINAIEHVLDMSLKMCPHPR